MDESAFRRGLHDFAEGPKAARWFAQAAGAVGSVVALVWWPPQAFAGLSDTARILMGAVFGYLALTFVALVLSIARAPYLQRNGARIERDKARLERDKARLELDKARNALQREKDRKPMNTLEIVAAQAKAASAYRKTD